MNIQLEARIWVAAHGLSLHDVGENETDRTNANSFVEDLVGLAHGRVEPYSFSRSAGIVPVVVELLDAAPPDDDLAEYDGVVDAPLHAGTGHLRIEGDGDTAIDFNVAPGDYRVRMAYANNGTARYDYSDGADHLRVSLWRAPLAKLVVHRPNVEEDDPVREYQGTLSEAKLRAWLKGPSLSHRCLAIVGLCQLGKVDALASVLEDEKHDAVIRIALAAAGFAGEGALSLLSDFSPKDNEMRLRMVQTLRHVGEGARKGARKVAEEVVESLDDEKDSDIAEMAREALEEVSGGDDNDDETDAPSWRRFEVDEKFWMIKLDGDAHTVRFGKTGTTGQEKSKEFGDEEAARKDYEKLIKEKTKKGYEEVTDD